MTAHGWKKRPVANALALVALVALVAYLVLTARVVWLAGRELFG